MYIPLVRLSRWSVVCLVFWLLAQVGAAAPSAVAQPCPERVIVVDDLYSPPFSFLDGFGAPRGITIDIWRLWSRKTGIPVEIRLMQRTDALAAVRAGRADAVGSLRPTPGRETAFDFATPLTTIPTALFFHRQIGGIKSLADMAGFQVGVVRGHGTEEMLRRENPNLSLQPYDNAYDLVRDAVAGNIKVFVADVPTVQFYLAKIPDGNVLRKTGDLLNSPRRAAVRKGNREMMGLLEKGFVQISAAEIEAIVAEGSGTPARTRQHPYEVPSASELDRALDEGIH